MESLTEQKGACAAGNGGPDGAIGEVQPRLLQFRFIGANQRKLRLFIGPVFVILRLGYSPVPDQFIMAVRFCLFERIGGFVTGQLCLGGAQLFAKRRLIDGHEQISSGNILSFLEMDIHELPCHA